MQDKHKGSTSMLSIDKLKEDLAKCVRQKEDLETRITVARKQHQDVIQHINNLHAQLNGTIGVINYLNSVIDSELSQPTV